MLWISKHPIYEAITCHQVILAVPRQLLLGAPVQMALGLEICITAWDKVVRPFSLKHCSFALAFR